MLTVTYSETTPGKEISRRHPADTDARRPSVKFKSLSRYSPLRLRVTWSTGGVGCRVSIATICVAIVVTIPKMQDREVSINFTIFRPSRCWIDYQVTVEDPRRRIEMAFST